MALATKVTAGSTIVAGILSTLLQDIKTEFTRRDNPYNKTGLGSIGETLALSTSDSVGNKITATQFKDALDMLYKISSDTGTLPSQNEIINVNSYNDGVTIVNTLEGYTDKATMNSSGCQGACQGLCYNTCYSGCSGCSGGSSSQASGN